MKLIVVILFSLASCLNGWAGLEYECDTLQDDACEIEISACCETPCPTENPLQDDSCEEGHCKSHCKTCLTKAPTTSASYAAIDWTWPTLSYESCVSDEQMRLTGERLPAPTPPPKLSV